MYNKLECQVKLSGEPSSSFKSQIGTRQTLQTLEYLYDKATTFQYTVL